MSNINGKVDYGRSRKFSVYLIKAHAGGEIWDFSWRQFFEDDILNYGCKK